MLCLVSLAHRVLHAEALPLELRVEVPHAKWLRQTPQLRRLCAEALHRTLQFKMAAVGCGQRRCAAPACDLEREQHSPRANPVPSPAPADKIPKKQPRPRPFLGWGEAGACTLEP